MRSHKQIFIIHTVSENLVFILLVAIEPPTVNLSTNIHTRSILLLDPERMIRGIVAAATEPQLHRDVDVAISINVALSRQPPHVAIVLLPRRAAKRTRHGGALRALGRRPLREALAVHVVAAGGPAPRDVVGVGLERHAADGAVVVRRDGLAGASGGVGASAGVGGRDWWRAGEDCAQLGRQQR